MLILFLVIDRYYFQIRYSSLVLCAICCSYLGVILSMIPKEWFEARERSKMKQAFTGLLNKDSSQQTNLGGTGSTGTSSTFDQIRAQRRLRNALFYNEIKT